MNAGDGPLAGVTVLELVRAAPGEFCTMLLADMGASVLKIETPASRWDHRRQMPPAEEEERAFSFTNRNKRSLALDLKSDAGRDIFGDLVRHSDVVVEGFRPGVMTRLGVGYETLAELNPELVYCALSGFGQSGPYRTRPAHDLNYLSLSGVLGLLGRRDQGPAVPLNLVADLAGAGLHGALGIMFALFARERGAGGQLVDISYLDTTISLLAATPNVMHLFSRGEVVRRGEGFMSGEFPYYAVYRAADGAEITVACVEPAMWARFCEAIGREDLVELGFRQAHMSEVAGGEHLRGRQQVQATLGTRTRAEWMELLALADVCVAELLDPTDLLADPHLTERGMVVTAPHPRRGEVGQFGVAIKLSGTPGAVRGAAPDPGADTDQVMAELGRADEVERLRGLGVIA